jgi:hypothetical protein
MLSQQTETLEIVLVNEGMALGRSIFFNYLEAVFSGGAGRLEKRKFVARVFSSPNGPYDFASVSFLQPITRESFDYRGVLIEAPQSRDAVNAWNQLRGLIESRGWQRPQKRVDSPWYSYRYERPLRTGAAYDRSRTERSRSEPTSSAQKAYSSQSSSKRKVPVKYKSLLIIVILLVTGAVLYDFWARPQSQFTDFYPWQDLIKELTSEPTPQAPVIEPHATSLVVERPVSRLEKVDRVRPVESTGQAQEPAPLETSNALVPEVIDGLETYGNEKLLNAAELQKLFDKLNSEYEKKPEEEKMRDDTYYGMMFVSPDFNINSISNLENDTVPKLIKRHEDAFNQMVHVAPYPDISLLNIRRVIFIQDNVALPDMYLLNQFIKDSDGGWHFSENNNLSDPEEALAYTDEDTGVNRLLMHHWGHTILNLSDKQVDFAKKNSNVISDYPVEEVPDYEGCLRPDIGRDLMCTGEMRIGWYDSLRLKQRHDLGIVHDKEKTLPDTLPDFPYKLPKINTFSLEDSSGKKLPKATVEFFRSEIVEGKKRLSPIGAYKTDESSNVTVQREKLFIPDREYGGVPQVGAENALLFLKVTSQEDEIFVKWVDMPDIMMGYLLGYKDHVRMYMQLAKEGDDPEDWRIQYGVTN